MPAAPIENPFRIHGVVAEQYFTNRAAELDRIGRTLREPAAKLLVYGPRRMGKTSALVRALEIHARGGGTAILADLSTASSLVDIANRILEAAGRELGRRWKDAIHDFVERVGIAITLTPDPATGLIVPSLDVGLRAAPLDAQQSSLARTLDAVDGLARVKRTTIGVVLDEFQEIQRFGGEGAEWHLRGIIQHHQHVSYILAGSQAHLIERMLDTGRAFYGLVDHLPFGPIEPGHLAAWIDDRMSRGGVKARGAGAAIVALAGPRTRDIVQVARQCFETCRARGRAAAVDAPAAFADVIAEQAPLLLSQWNSLTTLKQNVLRAIAADGSGLTTKASIRRFALTSSGAATNAAHAMVQEGLLLKSASRSGYVFESPFFRGWVAQATLHDLGGGAFPAGA